MCLLASLFIPDRLLMQRFTVVDLSGEIVVHVLTPEAAAKYDLVSIGQQSDFDLLREFD